MVVGLTPQQAWQLISDQRIDVIDVREPSEWAAGHIPGARLIGLAELRRSGAKILASVDAVVFICAGGVRSQTAGRLASQLGVKTVYSVVGGTRSWVKSGFPLAEELGVAV